MLEKLKRLVTTGTTDYLPRPRRGDTGMDHVRAMIEGGLLRLPEDAENRTLVMRNIEEITETRVGAALMARMRSAISKSGVPLSIERGASFTYDHENLVITFTPHSQHVFIKRERDGSYEISQPFFDTSLFHELVHVLGHYEDAPEMHLRRLTETRGPLKAFHNNEELKAITGRVHNWVGAFLRHDPVNENAYRRERGLMRRINHIGFKRQQVAKWIITGLREFKTFEKIRYTLELLRAALKADVLNDAEIDQIQEAAEHNPELEELPVIVESVFREAGTAIENSPSTLLGMESIARLPSLIAV